MHHEQKECPYKFSVEETGESYAIHIKGDKEKLKAKLDALEATGFFHNGDQNCNHGFLSLVHKHIQAFHKHSRTGTKSQAAE